MQKIRTKTEYKILERQVKEKLVAERGEDRKVEKIQGNSAKIEITRSN